MIPEKLDSHHVIKYEGIGEVSYGSFDGTFHRCRTISSRSRVR